MSINDPFQVGGTAGETLLGPAETFYKDNMSPDELSECVSQVLIAGCDRDILSGWGGIVYTM
jgi:20S proteasome subunit beta 3